MEDPATVIRTDCWDRALDCHALWYIFSKRTQSLSLWLRWTKILGILIPVFLGGMVASYYQNQALMNWAIILTTPLALGQLLLSTILTVSGTDENFAKYNSLTAEFGILYSDFIQSAKFPTEDLSEYKKRYEVLIERERGISKAIPDLKDKELRKGMRYALRDRRRACAGCGEVPISMESTDCDVCGKF